MSVDEPASLRRPADDELDVLVAVAEHVALVIEDAQSRETARTPSRRAPRPAPGPSRLTGR